MCHRDDQVSLSEEQAGEGWADSCMGLGGACLTQSVMCRPWLGEALRGRHSRGSTSR